ncbi:MAG: helix-turn-helix domain-containing protein [Synergistaceae bacterium]|nr:helix-turn-helix domain-containing protein [Synergistaceae bacterium]
MSRRKTQSRDFRTLRVTPSEAAAFLQVPERTFYRLVETGIIPKAGDGEYILGEVVESYWRNQFDTEGLKAAQTRLTTAQAELKELELAEQRGELHRASAIAKVWADNVLNAKKKLLAIPTKIPPMLVGQDVQTIRKRLEDEIKESLRELAGYDRDKITKESERQGN